MIFDAFHNLPFGKWNMWHDTETSWSIFIGSIGNSEDYYSHIWTIFTTQILHTLGIFYFMQSLTDIVSPISWYVSEFFVFFFSIKNVNLLTLKEGFTFYFLPRTFDAQIKQITGEHQYEQITFKLRWSFSYKASQINISFRLEKSKKEINVFLISLSYLRAYEWVSESPRL